MTFSTYFSSSIADLEEVWPVLASGAGPFADYRFLHTLENTGCVGGDTAWQPHHLVVKSANDIVAVMPGYLKFDSMGEYVFDHSWANAYYQHGLSYYPKWISAIPFTPVTTPKLLVSEHTNHECVVNEVLNAISTLEQTGISSTHLLFCRDEGTKFVAPMFAVRQSIQFQWFKYDYQSFDHFLLALTSRKRKDIKKVYRRLEAQQITLSYRHGENLTDSDIAFFIQCYQRTYLKRSGHTGYLTASFFYALANSMPENILIVTAQKNDVRIASALFLFDDKGLYGRYWGAIEEVDSLHFVCCYLEGIRFAITRDIPVFNPGTQGEHKLLRGFEPIYCYSLHHLFNNNFHQAVTNFVKQEHPHMIGYFNQAKDVLPFNNDFVPKLKAVNATPPSVAFDNNNKEKKL